MSIARIIDHTLLRADATQEEIDKLIDEAKQYQFASVCVNPSWVAYCSERLADTEIKVCTVIGFPLGVTTTAIKSLETEDAIDNGAVEVDMVINIGQLKGGNDTFVQQDIEAVMKAASSKALVKVIIETCLLTDEEKIRICKLALKAGADFVKTSTGFSTGGATREDIALMRRTVGQHMGVKASGGVRNLEDLNGMVEAGATRIGTSSSVSIMNGLTSTSS